MEAHDEVWLRLFTVQSFYHIVRPVFHLVLACTRIYQCWLRQRSAPFSRVELGFWCRWTDRGTKKGTPIDCSQCFVRHSWYERQYLSRRRLISLHLLLYKRCRPSNCQSSEQECRALCPSRKAIPKSLPRKELDCHRLQRAWASIWDTPVFLAYAVLIFLIALGSVVHIGVSVCSIDELMSLHSHQICTARHCLPQDSNIGTQPSLQNDRAPNDPSWFWEFLLSNLRRRGRGFYLQLSRTRWRHSHSALSSLCANEDPIRWLLRLTQLIWVFLRGQTLHIVG